MVHFEEMAVFVDDYILLYIQGEFGQVDVEVEVVVGRGGSPAAGHFFEADAANRARRVGAKEGEGFPCDFFGGAAVEGFYQGAELGFLLLGAQVIA